MKTKRVTKDSGKRQDFESGARRDTEDGKQSARQMDLYSWNDFMETYYGQERMELDTSGDSDTGFDPNVMVMKLYDIEGFCTGVRFFKLTPEGNWTPAEMLIDTIFLNRLQALMQRGAEKYDRWNWLKGIPLLRFFTSALRHLLQWRWGDNQEDHLAGVAFNVMGAMGIEHRVDMGIMDTELAEEGEVGVTLDR